jgi:hypothetical protein
MQSIIIATIEGAVLLSLHHLFSSGTDTSDRVSASISWKYKLILYNQKYHLKLKPCSENNINVYIIEPVL